MGRSAKSPRPRPLPDLEETYRRYEGSRRKRRSWAAENPGNLAIRAELLAAVLELGVDPMRGGDGHVLDVGCGGGWLLAEIAGSGIDQERLHGIDLLEGRVRAARTRLPAAELRHGDARALPFDDGAFGLVTLLTCLSSMPGRESIGRALDEAARVCAPGGRVLIYEPWLPNPFNRATFRVPSRLLEERLGAPAVRRRLTGMPPLARRLGPLTAALYPPLAACLPTHRISSHAPG